MKKREEIEGANGVEDEEAAASTPSAIEHVPAKVEDLPKVQPTPGQVKAVHARAFKA